MAKNEANGKQMVERRYGDDEIAQMTKRVCDIRDLIDKKKDELKALAEEEKEIRANRKRGYELVEGEQLPFTKEKRA